MGGESSKPVPEIPRPSKPVPEIPRPSKPVPEIPLFDEPWREIKWSDKQHFPQSVNNYKHSIKDQQIRILLHGAAGAGKSSFVNSVQNTLRRRMCSYALTDNMSHDSFTKKYMTHKIEKRNPEIFYPFVFNDTMGLGSDNGDFKEDLKLVLSGHVKDGYTFNPESRLSEESQFYIREPTANDKVHVLVCVVAADTLPTMSDEVVKKIRDIRLEASNMGIPQVALLTKVDKACPEVKKDLKNVYKNKYVKEKMEKFSTDVGIPMNYIFPVKNYHEEIDPNDEIDSLILSALKHIINFGEDFINRNLHV